MKLSELVNSADKSIAEIARKAGLSRPTVYKILKGESVEKLSIKKICKFFGLDWRDYV